MISFSAETFSSPKFQLFATAAASGLAVASLIFSYQYLQREEHLREVKKSFPSVADRKDVGYINWFGGSSASPLDKEDAKNQALAKRAIEGNFDEELILEQLARNQVFLTPEGLQKLRDSFVIVVGCGGVGSHCVASLARSGCSKIRLIDFDQVTLSSLNRHAVATLSDVGMPKVQCLKRRLIAIAPWVQFDLVQEKFEERVAKRMLGPWDLSGRKPDFIVDAIDNIDTKVALLKFCHDQKLPVISSMGAGCKSDPTKITIGDIGISTDDGLSRATRRRLKLLGVTSGIPVIYSTEKGGEGKAELLPLSSEEIDKGSVGDLGVMENFRVRILPVLGTMPAIFGLTAANHAILSITGYPLRYISGKQREKMYEGILAFVTSQEDKLSRLYHPGLTGLRVPLTPGDVAFLSEELYNGRSIISGLASRLVLIRWERPSTSPVVFLEDETGKQIQKACKLRLSDLICLTKEEAAVHEKEVFKAGKSVEEVWGKEVIERVEKKRREAEAYELYRS